MCPTNNLLPFIICSTLLPEQVERPVVVSLVSGNSINWSSFDNRRLSLGLQTFAHTVSLIRMRAESFLNLERSGRGDIRHKDRKSVDLSVVLSVFETVTILYKKIQGHVNNDIDGAIMDGGVDTGNNQYDALVVRQEVSPVVMDQRYITVDDGMVMKTLNFIVENLVCIIHFTIKTYNYEDVNMRRDEIERFQGIADGFRVGSFEHRAARWIRDNVDAIRRL